MYATETYLFKKRLCLPENVLQFSQLREVLLESLFISVHLTQFIFQFFEGSL